METYDAYIVAPIVNGTDIMRNPNVIKIHEVINNIVKLHNIKVDIYSPANIKINSETESRKSIDSALCVIIIVPTEYMRKFMLPIAHTISRNKKLYFVLRRLIPKTKDLMMKRYKYLRKNQERQLL